MICSSAQIVLKKCSNTKLDRNAILAIKRQSEIVDMKKERFHRAHWTEMLYAQDKEVFEKNLFMKKYLW